MRIIRETPRTKRRDLAIISPLFRSRTVKAKRGAGSYSRKAKAFLREGADMRG